MEELPDDLIPVAKPDDRELRADNQAPLPDDLIPVSNSDIPPGITAPNVPGFENLTPYEDPARKALEESYFAPILRATGYFAMRDIGQGAISGAKKGWGDKPLGSWLMDQPGMKTDLSTTVGQIGAAFNEGINRPLAIALDAVVRAPSALWHGAQEAGIEAGLPRDIVAMPDAFLGSPGGLARPRTPLEMEIAKNKRELGERTPITGGTAANPDVNVARDLGVIGPEKPDIRGLKPAEAAEALVQPVTAYHGSPYSFEAFTPEARGTGEGHAAFGHGVYVAENPRTAETYKAAGPAGEPGAGSLYEVRVHANADDMLDWDTKLKDQPKHVQKALQDAAERINEGWLPTLENELQGIRKNIVLDPNSTGSQAYGMLSRGLGGDAAASAALHEAGLPGLRYLDEGSRTLEAGQPRTRNMVVFDDSRVEIVARNGQPIERPPAVREMTETARQDVVRSEPVNAWRERFDEYVGKVETPEQVKDLIRKAADENADFGAARRGEISLAHQEALSHASGVPVEELNARGIGRMLRNDDQVRLATQAMLKQSQEVADLMKKVAQTDDITDLVKLQEALMRRDLLVEQFVGLRAEWGRTGNVFQEFTASVKDAQSLGKFLADKKGRSLDDLRNLAKAASELDPNTQLPRFLSDARKHSWQDKLFYFWTNSILSGVGSHAAYATADAIFTAYDATVVTPVAGAVGKVRQVLAGDAKLDRVYVGEAGARIAGLIKGTPDAIIAAVEAFKTGAVPLLHAEEAAMTLEQVGKRNAMTGQRPIEGAVGTAVGLPTRLLGVEQAFFKFLNYRAEVEAQAYRQAIKDGARPTQRDFWQKVEGYSQFPKEGVMDDAVAHANYMTYVQEFGPAGKSIQMMVARVPGVRWVAPFLRTPGNFLKIAQENSPISWMSQEFRDNLAGRNGGVAQDKAWAKTVVGSAVAVMVFNWAQEDRITGIGPPPGKERDIWLLDHKPNSIKIGDQWWSYMKLSGPLAAVISAAADLNGVKEAMKEGEFGEASARITLGAANTIVNQTGLSGLANLLKAMGDPERYGKRYINNTATGFVPFSSMLGQGASAMDPHMRDTKNLIDAFKNKVPVLRQTLYPLRDWMGRPIANDGEEFGAVIQHRKVNVDPIDMELKELDIRPTRVEERIRGVKLNQEQYDKFQSTAGALTGQVLEAYVNSPDWHDMSPFVRKNIIVKTIESTRQQAATAMQEAYPELIQKGVEDRVRAINGQKPIYNR